MKRRAILLKSRNSRRARKRDKSNLVLITPKVQREIDRLRRKRENEQLMERLHNDGLIALLTHFIDRHYGDPTKGRRGIVLTGPVGARLTAASSLRALLIENEPIQ